MRFVTLLLFACAAEPEIGQPPADAQSQLQATFRWGVALSHFQNAPDVDQKSDWYQWVTTPRIVSNPLLFMSGEPPTVGLGVPAEDLDRAAFELHAGAVRFSFEWSRLFPDGPETPSADAVAYYHDFLAQLRVRGLHPLATVNHVTLPLWLHDGNACNQDFAQCDKRGWVDARSVTEVARFARFLATEFGGEIDEWATLNEPFMSLVIPGYLLASPLRSNPPGLTGPWMQLTAAKDATLHLIQAHARVYDAIKAADRVDADRDGETSSVGLVNVFEDVVAGDSAARADAEYFLHEMFTRAVTEGIVDYDWNGNGVLHEDLRGRMDWLGVNYYFRLTAKTLRPQVLTSISPFLTFNPLETDADAPDGLANVLSRLAARYGKPLIVTEAGRRADSGDAAAQARWHDGAIRAVQKARRQGVDVRGYYAWTLVDNYEWNNGSTWKFGLYAVDPHTLARTARAAAVTFAGFAKD